MFYDLYTNNIITTIIISEITNIIRTIFNNLINNSNSITIKDY